MKTHSVRPPRKDKPATKPNYHHALRKCEETCTRIQKASEELAAGWTALGIEIATGATVNEVLRRRAWCNVLELRLKEQANALEQARLGMDEVWKDVMVAARGRDLFARLNGKNAPENIFAKSWALLLQPKTTPATRSRALPASK